MISTEVEHGTTLMAAAVRNNVSGIAAECGGAAARATCHVILDDPTYEKVNSPSVVEHDIFNFVENGRQKNSRLSCKLVMSEALDGAHVTVPHDC